ncbi:MAG: OmpA family protein [Zetaproteobacteria bacterium]|nr:OmpA family protein [Zetaproteobacteria bacterium]
MARKKKKKGEIVMDGWLATFGDLVSLMLTFFVMLLSMSTMDVAGVQDMFTTSSGEAKAAMMKESSESEDQIVEQQNRRLTQQEIELAKRQRSKVSLENSALKHAVRFPVEKDKQTMRIDGAALFREGRAVLQREARQAILDLGETLLLSEDYIRVEGFVSESEDLGRFRTPEYLSLARALNVLETLQDAGVESKRLSLVGYGTERSLTMGRTPHGQQKNTRVDIVLYAP